MTILAPAFSYWTAFAFTYFLIVVNAYLLKKNKSDTIATWKSFLALYAFLQFFPAIIIGVLLIILYRRLIHKVLAFTYKENYGGLLNGGDVIHVLDDINESKIKVLFVIEYDKNSTKSFYSHVKEQIYTSKVIKCLKTRAVYKKSYGYFYYLKNQLDIEDCIKPLTVGDSNTEVSALMQFLEDTENLPFPGNNSGLWDLFIGTHPINWRPEIPGKTYYPILLRYHHSLFDGYHLITTVFGNFSDAKIAKENFARTTTNTSSILKKIYNSLRELFEISAYPWRYFLVANSNNANILCKSQLKNQKIFIHRTEEGSGRYIQLIKEIKAQYPGVSFTDVILAATASSFSKYISKNSITIPNHISIGTPEVPQATDLLVSPFQGDEATFNCKNEVHFSLRNLPVHENMSTLQRLTLLKEQGGFYRKPYLVKTDYCVFNFFFSTLPDILLRKILKQSRTTAIVTNLPGPPKTTCLSGNLLEDMVMWSITKSTTNTGMSFLIFTYDNCLKFSLTVDKAVISDKAELEYLLSNVFKNLDELHQEVCIDSVKTNKKF